MSLIAESLGFVKNFLLLVLFIMVIFIIWRMRMDNDISYYVHPSMIDRSFVTQVNNILNQSEWNKKYRLKEVTDIQDADISIKLADRKELDVWHDKPEYYPSGKQIRFSITTQNWDTKPKIYIDSGNWLNGVQESGLSLNDYRRYVILHEFGHGLGFDHQPCNKQTAVNGVCPVMYQSTRGCPSGFKCGSYVIPADYTKKLTPRFII